MNAHTGWLGLIVEDLTPRTAAAWRTSVTRGVLVSAVVRQGPAHRAGLEVRDVIVEVNGRAVRDAADLQREVAEHCGDELSIEIRRDETRALLRLTVGELAA